MNISFRSLRIWCVLVLTVVSPVAAVAQLSPSVTNMIPSTGPTTGGLSITLLGSNFGLSGSVTLGGRDCPVQQWSETQIIFLQPAGQGTGLPVLATTTDGLSSSAISFDYQPPSISSISPSTGPTIGGTVITISGSNFGTSGAVELGGFACMIADWTHSRIICTNRPGQGTNVPLVVTVSGQSSQANTQFSYGAPSVAAISPASGPTTGGTVITIMGSNFGTFGSVTLGGSACAIGEWTQSGIICTNPPGQGANLPLVVTVSGLSSQSNPQFSYDAPSIASISPASGPTTGGTVITISGSSFGVSGSVTLGGSACAIADWTQSRIICTNPPGQGANVPLVVTVSGQSSQSNPQFSYDAPSVASISPATGPTTGGTVITISGSSFGVSGSVTLGGSACAIGDWTQSRIICTNPPGQGANVPLIVTVSGQSSQVNSQFSYNAPSVASISPATGPTTGGTVITISGSSFGVSGSVTLGGSACAIADWTQSRIICTNPPGQGANVPLVVTVSGQSSKANSQFSYAPPTISSVTPSSGPTAGGTVLTLKGSDFGNNGVVLLGGAVCPTRTWSHNMIVCTTPPGEGQLPLTVTVAGQSSPAAFFSYYPLLLSITATNAAMVLSWPETAADYLLESAGVLDPRSSAWTPASASLATNNGMISATVPTGPTNAFFRLHKP
jgi:hypothetical protein